LRLTADYLDRKEVTEGIYRFSDVVIDINQTRKRAL
jgi:hypothetical protein